MFLLISVMLNNSSMTTPEKQIVESSGMKLQIQCQQQ